MPEAAPRAATLLASIHDISPLTLEACRQAVDLLHQAAGIEARDLTLLAIPFHEGQVRLDQHAATVAWLRGLADDGATVVLHGLTHRMPRPTWNPLRFGAAYGFARGQGELCCVGGDDAARRLDEGRAILTRAGLEAATSCFVPPAWLLSPAARTAVDAAGFAWTELYDGLHTPRGTRRLRLIGWGSLNPIEAMATRAFAFLQRQRRSVDTRLVVHPADLRRPAVRRSIATTARRLRRDLVPASYSRYLEVAPIGENR
jgi:predicted deacetylase